MSQESTTRINPNTFKEVFGVGAVVFVLLGALTGFRLGSTGGLPPFVGAGLGLAASSAAVVLILYGVNGRVTMATTSDEQRGKLLSSLSICLAVGSMAILFI